MDVNLELLIELQASDDQIRRLEKLCHDLPEQMGEHNSALGAAKKEYEAFKKRVEDANKERLSKEREVEMKNQAIAKSRLKLNEVKTNQEYTAALAEIENMKHAISTLEEEQLEIMEKLDSNRAEEKALKERVAVEEKDFAKFKAEKESELESLKVELARHQAHRAEIAAKIAPAMLGHYDRIFNVREGKGVAELKNGFCMACHQAVLPQVAVEVRMGTVIHKCPHCLRFLYPAREEKGEEAHK